MTWVVNNRPQVLPLAYRPATLGILVMLWAMVLAAVLSNGLRLPAVDSGALTSPELRRATMISFASLLGLLTGADIFASMELAYEGLEPQRSRKALLSLLMVAATSLVFLLLAGPAIVAQIDPADASSVIYQGIVGLLPGAVGIAAVAVGVLALLVVTASAMLAMQSLVLGLRDRRYAPAFLGQRNRSNVANRPVRILAALAVGCFLLVGSQPGIYLPVYVVGTLLLLAIASAGVVRRSLQRDGDRRHIGPQSLLAILAAAVVFLATAAVLLTGLRNGAWLYLVIVPVLFFVFRTTRRKMGSPNPLQEELGRKEQAMHNLGLPPSGDGLRARIPSPSLLPADEASARGRAPRWTGDAATIHQVAVALDGSAFSEAALPVAARIAHMFDATMVLMTVLPARGALRILPKGRSAGNPLEAGQVETELYLSELAGKYRSAGVRTEYYLAAGPVAQAIETMVTELDADLLVMSTHGRSGIGRFMLGSNASAAIQVSSRPVLLMRPQATTAAAPVVRKVLTPLDGSGFAERVLPWMLAVARVVDCEFILLAVPEVPEPAMYGAMADAVEDLRQRAEANSQRYLTQLAERLSGLGLQVRPVVGGSRPATAILELAEQEQVDLIMLATHGRGGMDRLVMGSVADRVVHHSTCPIFLLPVRDA
ncbi:MAG: universal stress protein [Caldilineales bacterium]